MEKALRAAFLADAGIVALLGVAPAGIAWKKLIQGTPLPAITLHRVTGGLDPLMDGVGDTIDPLVDVHCDAESYAAAVELANAVRVCCAALTTAPFQVCDLEGWSDDDGVVDGPGVERSDQFFRIVLQVRPCFTPLA